MVNKGFLSMNICSHPRPNRFLIIVFIPIAFQKILFPVINTISLVIGMPNFYMASIQLFRSPSTSSVRTVWGPDLFIFLVLLVHFSLSDIVLLGMER